MGYTHYWRRVPQFNDRLFGRAVQDIQKMLPVFERFGIVLAGGSGEGSPTINSKHICFNGPTICGHAERDLGITWPSSTARGVNEAFEAAKTSVAGKWFAGAKLQTRCCGGDCSHETFDIPVTLKPASYQKPDEKGFYSEFCKTAFKPYDLAVNCCLIIFKEYLGGAIKVSSDGELEQWVDAMVLCQKELGYGAKFKFDQSE